MQIETNSTPEIALKYSKTANPFLTFEKPIEICEKEMNVYINQRGQRNNGNIDYESHKAVLVNKTAIYIDGFFGLRNGIPTVAEPSKRSTVSIEILQRKQLHSNLDKIWQGIAYILENSDQNVLILIIMLFQFYPTIAYTVSNWYMQISKSKFSRINSFIKKYKKKSFSSLTKKHVLFVMYRILFSDLNYFRFVYNLGLTGTPHVKLRL